MMICGVDPMINLVLMIRMMLLFFKNRLSQQGMNEPQRVAVPTLPWSPALRLEFTQIHEVIPLLLGQRVMHATV